MGDLVLQQVDIPAAQQLGLKMYLGQQVDCVNKRYGNNFGAAFFNMVYQVLIENIILVSTDRTFRVSF